MGSAWKLEKPNKIWFIWNTEGTHSNIIFYYFPDEECKCSHQVFLPRDRGGKINIISAMVTMWKTTQKSPSLSQTVKTQSVPHPSTEHWCLWKYGILLAHIISSHIMEEGHHCGQLISFCAMHDNLSSFKEWENWDIQGWDIIHPHFWWDKICKKCVVIDLTLKVFKRHLHFKCFYGFCCLRTSSCPLDAKKWIDDDVWCS